MLIDNPGIGIIHNKDVQMSSDLTEYYRDMVRIAQATIKREQDTKRVLKLAEYYNRCRYQVISIGDDMTRQRFNIKSKGKVADITAYIREQDVLIIAEVKSKSDQHKAIEQLDITAKYARKEYRHLRPTLVIPRPEDLDTNWYTIVSNVEGTFLGNTEKDRKGQLISLPETGENVRLLFDPW
jgi:hypothetical protein